MTETTTLRSSHAVAAIAENRGEERHFCVGIALHYSAAQDCDVAGLGGTLQHAALVDMSLRGLSFDVEVPLSSGQELLLLVEQPRGEPHERLLSEVRWCEKLAANRYRIGVRINAAAVTSDDPRKHVSFPIAVGLAIPVGAELQCPACGRNSLFHLVGQQPIAYSSAMMPLYNCAACGTTRTITSVLAHRRRQITTSAEASAPPIISKAM